MCRGERELLKGLTHRRKAGLADVDPVNFLGLNNPHTDGTRRATDQGIKGFTLGGGELFAVIEPGEFAGLREDDRGGDDGTGQRAAAGFINTGDARVLAEKRLVELEERRSP